MHKKINISLSQAGSYCLDALAEKLVTKKSTLINNQIIELASEHDIYYDDKEIVDNEMFWDKIKRMNSELEIESKKVQDEIDDKSIPTTNDMLNRKNRLTQGVIGLGLLLKNKSKLGEE